ncbi:hypothetical protein, partial [Escherichia ruysiae]|uniref:hypothetical protein n=1 Tax=Escherichia ruysiae TaxID=2608867 RepID=UPI00215A2683
MKISDIKIGEIVLINGHEYEFKGQQMRSEKGFKSSKYVFRGVRVEGEKTFNVTADLKFRKTGDKT